MEYLPETTMHVTVITLFPELYPGPLGVSVVGKALQTGLWSLRTLSIRSYATDKHHTVDDTCYGGGAGMVLRPDVVDAALRDATCHRPASVILYMTPRGEPLRQHRFNEWSEQVSHLVVLCGRYEGVDQRVLEAWNVFECSLGDFVLCAGDIPAMALIEGCIRLLPGVVHSPESVRHESFQEPMLEHPQYTRPAVWQGRHVPSVLLSGNHAHIEQWKRERSLADTHTRRPDLLPH